MANRSAEVCSNLAEVHAARHGHIALADQDAFPTAQLGEVLGELGFGFVDIDANHDYKMDM
ncbi:MAG: hypothetical protein MN733_39690 [Nitrososphaera sp.]|nr:hypothetical protein [Nitrososphaera sp.]